MLNYSISYRRSTPGDSTSEQLAYANIQYTDKMTTAEFCQHIADHGSVYAYGDIFNVVSQVVSCLRELLLEGYRIELGSLGTFQAKLSSVGAETAADFTAANITYVGVRWTIGEEFENMRDDATFNLVATREQQAAVLAAIKDGSDTVTLTSSSSSSDESEEEETV